MTIDEKRHQKAMLLLEFQEANENLAHLREKANRIVKPVCDVAQCLKAAAEASRSYDNKETAVSFAIKADRNAYMEALASVLDVLEEIRAAEEELEKLGERKAALGLK